MKVRQAMLNHWEVQRLLALLDADEEFGLYSKEREEKDNKLYDKLTRMEARFKEETQ